MEDKTIKMTGFYFTVALALFGVITGNFKTLFFASDGEKSLIYLWNTLDGRASALLTVLAGFAVTEYTNNERYFADIMPVRKKMEKLSFLALLIFVIGILLFPLWYDEILPFFGLSLFIGVAFINRSSIQLWIAVFLFNCLFVVWLVSSNLYLEGINNMNPTAHIDFSSFGVKDAFRMIVFNGFYPIFPWISLFLAGMWLGRQKIEVEIVRNRIIIFSLLVGIIIGSLSQVLIKFFETKEVVFGSVSLKDFFETNSTPPVPFFLLATGSISIAVILLSISVVEYIGFKKIKAIVYFGQMPFTMYILHIFAGIFVPKWLKLPEKLPIEILILYAFIFLASSIIFSYLWRKKFKKGPVEYIFSQIAGV